MYACLFAAISVLCFLNVAEMVPDVDSYSWTRTLSNGNDIRQKAASIDDGPRAFINSYDYRMFWNGLRPSRTIIDFSQIADPEAVVVVNVGYACYIVDLYYLSNYTQIVTELTSRDGTTVTDALTEVNMDATGEGARLNSTERDALFDTNPSMTKICNPYRTSIYQTTAVADFTAGDCEREISTVTLDTRLNILTPISYGYCGYRG